MVTLAQIIVHAAQALEPDSPDWLYLAVIAVCVLMPHILIHFVVELKKILLLMLSDAVLTNVEVGFDLRFIPFALRLNLTIAFITVQMQHPFVIGFSELVAHAEEPKTKVMIPGEHLDLLFAFEDHFDDRVEIFGLLRFFSDFPKDHIGIDSRAQHHGLPIFPGVFVAH